MTAAASTGTWPELIAFTDAEPSAVMEFAPAASAPFLTHTLRRWQPGELTKAMTPLGIVVPPQFTLPLVAVIDSEGRVAAEWQGITSIEPIAGVVREIGD
jgi:hypothetical protein